MFGEPRLQELLEGSAAEGLDQLRDRVFQAVRGFAAGTPQGDDMTVIVARRESAGAVAS
jgi:serine phosphatase RsbU (regulator of sigma subunit)